MREYFAKHKFYLLTFVILILVMGVSGVYLKITKIQNTRYKQYPIISNIQYSIDNQSSTSPNIVSNTNNSASSADRLTPTTTPQGSTTTYYRIEVKDYKLHYPSVENLMSIESTNGRYPFFVEEKNYAGLGKFVESINGLKNNPQTGEYWIYYINSKPAQMGISNQVVAPGDVIEWKYEKSTF